jgi:hypothetical protein
MSDRAYTNALRRLHTLGDGFGLYPTLDRGCLRYFCARSLEAAEAAARRYNRRLWR